MVKTSVSVPQNNRTRFRTGGILKRYNWFFTNDTRYWYDSFPFAIRAKYHFFAILQKSGVTTQTGEFLSSCLISRFSPIRCAFPVTIYPSVRFIIPDQFTAIRTFYFNFTDKVRDIIITTEFISHCVWNIRETQFPHSPDRYGGYSDMPVFVGFKGRGAYFVNRSKAIRQDVIIIFGKLLACNLDPRTIPRSIIANQTSQSDRVVKPIHQFSADDLPRIAVKQGVEIGKARGRDCMKPSSPPSLPIPLIKIFAILNRTRVRLNPLPFDFQPIKLFFGVITGHMVINSVFGAIQRRIAQKRTETNLFLESCE